MTDRPGVGALLPGARLALTTFTIVPLRSGRLDRSVAGAAMVMAPAVGGLLGIVVAAVLLGLGALGAAPALAAAVAVGTAAALTRGLHLDGLADTVDALGSYRRGEAALAVMKQPDVGPFGVVALVLTLLTQAAALAQLAQAAWPSAVLSLVAANAAGRLAATWSCRRGLPAARTGGMGALVAGTVPLPGLATATVAVLAVAVWAVDGRLWYGPAAVAAAGLTTLVAQRHAIRRVGGITGDLIGAAIEMTTTVAYVLLALSAPTV